MMNAVRAIALTSLGLFNRCHWVTESPYFTMFHEADTCSERETPEKERPSYNQGITIPMPPRAPSSVQIHLKFKSIRTAHLQSP